MFNIPRPRLVTELWELTRRGSVMVSGAPGIGKSWLLGQLAQRCADESRAVTTLVAEDFHVSTLQQIHDNLGFSRPLPKLLANLPDPVLIIDGMDALRADSSQRAFRELIHEVVEWAPNASIVASVRTFDLQESPELQSLLNRYSGSGRGMQKLVVGELSNDEVLDAVNSNPELFLLIIENSGPLFELLRNPFNLHLALSLLKQGVPPTELHSVQSQVQLLEKFWAYRVVGSQGGLLKERVLKDISERMVEARTLSVPETDIAQAGFQEPLRELKSAEVLRKNTTGRLFYAHNILFDYALSRLLLDEYRVFDFVKADPARSLFFRPSLTFFFHRLWAFDRELFWKVTVRSLSASEIPERLRVLPAVALSEAARNSDEISPEVLRENLSGSATTFIGLLLRAVLALRGFEGGQRYLWLGWILSLSGQMHKEWINEMLTALSIVHSSMLRTEIEPIGQIARKILDWEFGPPPDLTQEEAQRLSSVATGRLLPIIADTYDSAPDATEGAIRRVIARIGKPESASNEAFWLVKTVPTVIQKSPVLAEDIYLALYSHGEGSDEMSRNGGVIMPFTMSRKQEFSSALYGLISIFRFFLERDSIRAARVAIKAAESETLRERLKDERRRFPTKEYEKSVFRLRGRVVVYQADYSEIWDGGTSRDLTSLSILEAALEFASQAEGATRSSMIEEICHYASLGISWKHLLTRAKLHPEALYQDVKDLLFIPKFIAAPEVTVDVGDLLKAAFERKLVSNSDSEQIEQAIVRIAKTKFVRRYEKPETIQLRLVGCLDPNSVKNPVLLGKIKRWTAAAKTRENRPFHRSSFGAFSPSMDDEYRRAGIDPDAGPNADVIAAMARVREFESRHLNSAPTDEESVAIEPALRELHDLVAADGVTPQVAENGRGTLYAAVNALSRNATLGADSKLVRLFRGYAIEGSTDREPVFDPKYHLPFDTAGWGSPSPRIEALQALGHLIWNYFADDEIVAAFCRAATDEVPAVRFQVGSYLRGLYKRGLKEKFWETLTSMLEVEATSGVSLALLHSLQAVAGPEPERTMDVFDELSTRGLPSTERSESRRALVEIPIGLFVFQAYDRARLALARFGSDPTVYEREISNAIFIASHYFDPKKTKDSVHRSRAREATSLLFMPARDLLARRNQLNNSPDLNRRLLSIVDSVASRIVFSFGLPKHGVTGTDVMDSVERAEHYKEMRPLLEQLLGEPNDPAPIPLSPQSAYYLLQLMTEILGLDPVRVLSFGAAICEGGSYFGFELDASARDEAVELVEHAVADYKETLKDSAQAVGRLLDLFVKAGWSQALALTFRLDDAFRG